MKKERKMKTTATIGQMSNGLGILRQMVMVDGGYRDKFQDILLFFNDYLWFVSEKTHIVYQIFVIGGLV